MTFPTPWTVQQEVFTETGVDDLGNDVETWAPATGVQVIAWQNSQVENVNGHTSRVVADLDMAVPASLTVSVRDRFTLPGDAAPYEVVAVEDANHGFHQWAPGYIVKLRKVSG